MFGSTHRLARCTGRRWMHPLLDIRFAGTIAAQPLPVLAKLVQNKENHTPFYKDYQGIVPKADRTLLANTGDLQDFLMCVSQVYDGSKSPANSEQKQSPEELPNYKKLEGLKDSESVFVLVFQTMLKALNPDYTSDSAKENLAKFGGSIDEVPTMMLSREVIAESPLGSEAIETIVADPDFLKAVQLLKYKLEQENGWSQRQECRDDSILRWINSVFELSVPKAMKHLVKSGALPQMVVYDMLLRKPKNELEFMSLLELYSNDFVKINLKDQEKLYHMKQLDTHANGKYAELRRELILPPAFDNLLSYALRFKVESLPRLVELFLDKNNKRPPAILPQLSEIIWRLSYDKSGNSVKRPSRFYKSAQSQLIRAVNSLVAGSQHDIDVTTLLGVSNLTYLTSRNKSYKLYQEAKKRFDIWQLESFDLAGFEKIVVSNNKGGLVPQTGSGRSIDEIRTTRRDYNLKFLCNSVILMGGRPGGTPLFDHFFGLLRNTNAHLTKMYPELWDMVMLKLCHDSLLGTKECSKLFQLYLEKFGGHIQNPMALDLMISKVNSGPLLMEMLSKLYLNELDELTLSRFISKLYKMNKLVEEQRKILSETPADNLNKEADVGAIIEHYQDVVAPRQPRLVEAETSEWNPESFEVKGYKDPVALARALYDGAPFKSSRLNASHLLGESIVSPQDTYNRYSGLNRFTKVTPVALSSLFYSALRLKEMKDDTTWGETEAKPIDVALEEFDKHVSGSYGDLTDGKVYPDDYLLSMYLRALRGFNKHERLYGFLDKMVDLRYPVRLSLFQLYLSLIPAVERAELLEALNSYYDRFKQLQDCKTEYQLKQLKERLKPTRATGQFKAFTEKLDFTWDIVRKWVWPGKM